MLCFTSEVSAERAKCQSCIRIHSHFLHDHTFFSLVKSSFEREVLILKNLIILIICFWTRWRLLIELWDVEDCHPWTKDGMDDTHRVIGENLI